MIASTTIRLASPFSPGLDGTTVILPTRYDGFGRVLLGIWIGAWAIVETSLAAGLVSVLRNQTPNPIASIGVLVMLLAFFTAAGAFMVWRLVWVLRGREILSVTPDRLLLHRIPSNGSPVAYDRSKIRDLHVGTYDPQRIYPSWGRRFVGKESAYIGFQYEGKSCRIARGLPHADAKYVCGLLRE